MPSGETNPYEPTSDETVAATPANSPAANTLYVCYLLLFGFPLFTACTFMHSCMCGHLQHATFTTLPFHIALDLVLASVFASAAFFGLRSTFKHTRTFAVLLTLIYVDHVLLVNGAGYFFILIDAPIMIFIAIRCLSRWREAKAAFMAI